MALLLKSSVIRTGNFTPELKTKKVIWVHELCGAASRREHCAFLGTVEMSFKCWHFDGMTCWSNSSGHSFFFASGALCSINFMISWMNTNPYSKFLYRTRVSNIVLFCSVGCSQTLSSCFVGSW